MAKLGHIVTEETRQKLRLANLGKKQSEETRQKKRIASTGNQYALGYKHTEETKKRMSVSHMGIKISEARVKLLIGNKHRLGIPHSEETKTKMSESRIGPKNGNWKGGITPINRSIRTSKNIKEWRKKVFERDNYTCVLCGLRSGIGVKVVIHADHIKPFAYYPELRFELSNGRTLCVQCHKNTPTYGGNSKKKTR